jgi:hypothetical protein
LWRRWGAKLTRQSFRGSSLASTGLLERLPRARPTPDRPPRCFSGNLLRRLPPPDRMLQRLSQSPRPRRSSNASATTTAKDSGRARAFSSGRS